MSGETPPTFDLDEEVRRWRRALDARIDSHVERARAEGTAPAPGPAEFDYRESLRTAYLEQLFVAALGAGGERAARATEWVLPNGGRFR